MELNREQNSQNTYCIIFSRKFPIGLFRKILEYCLSKRLDFVSGRIYVSGVTPNEVTHKLIEVHSIPKIYSDFVKNKLLLKEECAPGGRKNIEAKFNKKTIKVLIENGPHIIYVENLYIYSKEKITTLKLSFPDGSFEDIETTNQKEVEEIIKVVKNYASKLKEWKFDIKSDKSYTYIEFKKKL